MEMFKQMLQNVIKSVKMLNERSNSGYQSEKTLTKYQHERNNLMTHDNLNMGLAYAGVIGGFSFFGVFALVALSGEWLVAFLIAIVISSSLGLVTFDRMVQSSRESREIVTMDWSKDSQQTVRQKIAAEENKQVSNYQLTNHLFYEIACLISKAGKINRDLMEQIDLTQYFEPPNCDWKKIYPKLAGDLRERGFVRKRGQGYLVTNNGKECFDEWASWPGTPDLPAPSSPEEGKVLLIS